MSEKRDPPADADRICHWCRIENRGVYGEFGDGRLICGPCFASMNSVPAVSDADHIAQLIAEGQRLVREIRQQTDAELKAERTAHERTKAELADSRVATLMRTSERDAAQAEAAALRWAMICDYNCNDPGCEDVSIDPHAEEWFREKYGNAGRALAAVVEAAEQFIERTSEIDEKHPAYGFVVMGIPLARALANARLKSPTDKPCNCLQNDSDSVADHGGACPQHGKTRRP